MTVEITPGERQRLGELLAAADYAHPDDPELFETGPHRALFNYLHQQMGIDVVAGRGPVYAKARELVGHFDETLAIHSG